MGARLLGSEEALFRALYWTFAKYDAQCAASLMNALRIDAKAVISLLSYAPQNPTQQKLKIDTVDAQSLISIASAQFVESAAAYWTFNFVFAAVSHSLEAVRALIGLIGEELFCRKLWRRDRFNVNALEFASVFDFDTLRFLLELDAVMASLRSPQSDAQSAVRLYRLLCHCCRYGEDAAFALILEKGELDSDAMLRAMLSFAYPQSARAEDEKCASSMSAPSQSRSVQTFYDKTLLSWAILGGRRARIARLLPLCSKESVMRTLLKADAQGRKPFCHIVKKKKYTLALELLKAVADTENQLTLIALACAELNDSTIQRRFEQMIVQTQQRAIRKKKEMKDEEVEANRDRSGTD